MKTHLSVVMTVVTLGALAWGTTACGGSPGINSAVPLDDAAAPYNIDDDDDDAATTDMATACEGDGGS